MENLLKNPILQTTGEELSTLREQYGINDEKKTDIDIMAIKDWMKTENHLVEASEYINDNIVKRMYILANGSFEETKIKIDKYCTSKGLFPEACLNKGIDEFDLLRSKVEYIVLPKLNPKDLSRITLVRFLTSDLSDITLLSILRYVNLIEDYVQSCDFNMRITTIVDYNNFPFSFFMKLNPILLKRSENLFTKAYGYEVKGLHMVNVPNFIDKVVIFIKYSLSKTLGSAIHVHQTYEDLQKHFPKEILPKEYGGDGPSCSDISERWKQTLQSVDGRKIVANSEKLIADETRRKTRKLSEKFFGMLNSFR